MRSLGRVFVKTKQCVGGRSYKTQGIKFSGATNKDSLHNA